MTRTYKTIIYGNLRSIIKDNQELVKVSERVSQDIEIMNLEKNKEIGNLNRTIRDLNNKRSKLGEFINLIECRADFYELKSSGVITLILMKIEKLNGVNSTEGEQ